MPTGWQPWCLSRLLRMWLLAFGESHGQRMEDGESWVWALHILLSSNILIYKTGANTAPIAPIWMTLLAWIKTDFSIIFLSISSRLLIFRLFIILRVWRFVSITCMTLVLAQKYDAESHGNKRTRVGSHQPNKPAHIGPTQGATTASRKAAWPMLHSHRRWARVGI